MHAILFSWYMCVAVQDNPQATHRYLSYRSTFVLRLVCLKNEPPPPCKPPTNPTPSTTHLSSLLWPRLELVLVLLRLPSGSPCRHPLAHHHVTGWSLASDLTPAGSDPDPDPDPGYGLPTLASDPRAHRPSHIGRLTVLLCSVAS